MQVSVTHIQNNSICKMFKNIQNRITHSGDMHICVIKCKRKKGMKNSMFGREVTSRRRESMGVRMGAQKASIIFVLLCLLIWMVNMQMCVLLFLSFVDWKQFIKFLWKKNSLT